MGPESSDRSTAPGGAGFISYASEDATAAERIASAPRSAGIEVWLDQSELRGGGAWDRKIRKEIALFIPIISANAHAWDGGLPPRIEALGGSWPPVCPGCDALRLCV